MSSLDWAIIAVLAFLNAVTIYMIYKFWQRIPFRIYYKKYKSILSSIKYKKPKSKLVNFNTNFRTYSPNQWEPVTSFSASAIASGHARIAVRNYDYADNIGPAGYTGSQGPG